MARKGVVFLKIHTNVVCTALKTIYCFTDMRFFFKPSHTACFIIFTCLLTLNVVFFLTHHYNAWKAILLHVMETNNFSIKITKYF